MKKIKNIDKKRKNTLKIPVKKNGNVFKKIKVVDKKTSVGLKTFLSTKQKRD